MLQSMYQSYQQLHQHKLNRFIHIATTFTIPYWLYLSVNNHVLLALWYYILSNHILCFTLGHSLEKNNREVLLHAKTIPQSIKTMLFFTLFSPILRVIDLYHALKDTVSFKKTTY
jgi:hypothetical protein